MTDVMDTTRTEPPVPQLMPAADVERFGPADTIRYGELPMPRVELGHALGRIAAVRAAPVWDREHQERGIRARGMRVENAMRRR